MIVHVRAAGSSFVLDARGTRVLAEVILPGMRVAWSSGTAVADSMTTGPVHRSVSVSPPTVRGMIIDCESCTVRGDACSDCVVTFMTVPVRQVGRPGGRPTEAAARAAPGMDLDEAERHAIDVLARSGLVPPLRMARAV